MIDKFRSASQHILTKSKLPPIFFVLILINIFFLILSLIGFFLDSRLIMNMPAWSKTLKFSISIFLYEITLTYILFRIDYSERVKKLSLLSIMILTIQIIIIATQAIRGYTMHFNYSSFVNSFLWFLLTVFIFTFFALNFFLCLDLIKLKFNDEVFALGVRLSFVIFLIGMELGMLMPFPSSPQFSLMLKGIHLDYWGGHSTNALIDGQTRMIPLLGWNMNGGDLRIPHFVGMHGFQFVLLVSLLLSKLKKKLSTTKQIILIWIGFISYVGLTGIITWQALRNESIVFPSMLTINVLLTWFSLTLVSIVGVLQFLKPKW